MEVKQRIQQKADELFFRYGAKAVTMDDIARELGISKKTIYLHFPDKDAVVLSVVQQHIHNDKCEYEYLNEQVPNVVERFLKASAMMRESLTMMNPHLVYEIQKYHPRAWQVFEQHLNDFALNAIVSELKQGIVDGVFRSDFDIEVLAKLRLKQVQLGFDPFLFPPNKYNIANLQDTFLMHFMAGILTEKGRGVLNEINKQNN